MGWNATLLRVVKLKTGWKGNPIRHTYIDNVPIHYTAVFKTGTVDKDPVQP